MKVLFLDVDGVLNNRLTPNVDGWPIDPHMAFLVARIVDRTGCVVVLSSSWRVWPEGLEIVRKKVCPIVSLTPDRYGLTSRGWEIKMWLDEWSKGTLEKSEIKPGGVYNESISAYAILDDNNDMLPEQMPHFFQTSFSTGLTEDIAAKVIEHLNVQDRAYPLLLDAPAHGLPAFIDYLREKNVVVFENESWIIIENCKYHTPERPWLTAFAKTPHDIPDLGSLSAWIDWEWKKKSSKAQTVKRFHIHMYKPL